MEVEKAFRDVEACNVLGAGFGLLVVFRSRLGFMAVLPSACVQLCLSNASFCES